MTLMSRRGLVVTATGASHELSDAWTTKVLPLCQAAFNRY